MKAVSQAQASLFGLALDHKEGRADLRGMTREMKDRVTELSKLDAAKLKEAMPTKLGRLPTRSHSHPGMQRKVRSA